MNPFDEQFPKPTSMTITPLHESTRYGVTSALEERISSGARNLMFGPPDDDAAILLLLDVFSWLDIELPYVADLVGTPRAHRPPARPEFDPGGRIESHLVWYDERGQADRFREEMTYFRDLRCELLAGFRGESTRALSVGRVLLGSQVLWVLEKVSGARIGLEVERDTEQDIFAAYSDR